MSTFDYKRNSAKPIIFRIVIFAFLFFLLSIIFIRGDRIDLFSTPDTETVGDVPDISEVVDITEEIEETEITENTSEEHSDYAGDHTYTVSVGKKTVEFTIPEYTSEPFAKVNDYNPFFTTSEIEVYSNQYGYEYYSNLDDLGRCGYTMALVGRETMPTDARGEISSVKPSGWKQKKYDADLVDGRYIYNRAHLIGFQLAGENANKKNLITGTRYFNVDGMLPFENMIADYVHETNNHVLYRVTPVFEYGYLVADGVLMEAYSIEDAGDGVYYCVFVYNVQPGITIDYATGESHLSEK